MAWKATEVSARQTVKSGKLPRSVLEVNDGDSSSNVTISTGMLLNRYFSGKKN